MIAGVGMGSWERNSIYIKYYVFLILIILPQTIITAPELTKSIREW